jgi:enoyl-CoA hydratase/carnithine racemase
MTQQPAIDNSAHAAGPFGARRDLFLATAGLTVASVAARAQTPAPAPPRPGNVLVERRDDGILLVGIDRTEARNRMDPAVLLGLGKAFYLLDHDPALRVAVLYGNGPDFCLGVDVPALGAALAAGQWPPKDPDYVPPFSLVPPARAKPVVVAVQGGIKFGGHELFLAADIRVAASDSVFSQGEVTRGIFPAGGATVRFVREAGWGNAMSYMLTGGEWNAEEARRLGLVQEITPLGQQKERAIEIARKIAAAAPLGVAATLASAHQSLAGEEPALAALPGLFAGILRTDDAKELGRAAQEHRAPVFKGR